MTDIANKHKLATVDNRGPFVYRNKIGRFLLINLVLAIGIQLLLNSAAFTSWELFKLAFDDLVYSFIISCFLSGGIGVIIQKADQHFPWLDAPLSRLVFDVLVVTAYTFIVSFSLATIFAIYVWDYFTLEKVGWGAIAESTITPIIIALSITLFLTSRSFLLEWRQAAIAAEHMRSERLEGQYQSLKDQLNPHFLFNSLNVLSNLVYEDADQANAFIEKLSGIYRYVLDVQYEELIPLERELAFAKNYLELQKLRFGDKLKYEVNVSDQIKYNLPPLTLQLLLENAVKHNAATKKKPLHITILQEVDQLKISNTMSARSTAPEESGIGLKNIKERYGFLTEREISIISNEDTFTVIVPLLKSPLSQ
jgi:sensor histidine kinase YesM